MTGLQSRNFVLNPGEGIKISAFKLDGTLEAQSDRELEKLGRYLVWLASHTDFKEVDHKVGNQRLIWGTSLTAFLRVELEEDCSCIEGNRS